MLTAETSRSYRSFNDSNNPVMFCCTFDENSPFVGTYGGKFTFRSANPNFASGEGLVRTLSVAGNGKVTGTFNPPSGELGEFNGSVDEEGTLTYSVQFATQTYVVRGLVVKTKRGSLKGSATQYAGRNADH